ncbi:MAG: Na(+)-translocating NADH-quinone reductase subunit C [Flavobacteriaceae bacterium]|nr:Na(+)-translocating NADH-quinone reductase subunit C [Flavobacteriaceae bacterium]OUX39094.1 MAG: Na(+)-translocating NADH-quinone reductase subunit C [Flavobacteriaceae bacterium TMED265]
MSINTEKNSYTIIFAVVMVAVVGSLLALMATGLKSKIKENERFEKQQNILYAMGVNRNQDDSSVNFIPTTEVESIFKNTIEGQYVLTGGEIKAQEEAYLIDLKKEITKIKKGDKSSLPLFIGSNDNQKYYIIPMYGKGLWDAIWGYMAVDEQMIIKGVYFDHKAETPGLGANIKLRYFMDDFIGESIAPNGKFGGVSVVKGNNDPLNEDKSDAEVDALAGATITGNGVSDMIKESVKLYQPFLQSIMTN